MEELFYLLLLLLFFLAPVLERVLKGRRAGKPPARQSPGEEGDWELTTEGMSPSPEYTGPRDTSGGRSGAGSTAAEDVIPDDLWEILTGERRQPPPSEPEWEPEPEPEHEFEEPRIAYEPEVADEAWSVEIEESVPDYRIRLPDPIPAPARTARDRAERADATAQFRHEPIPAPRAARQARLAPPPPRRPAFEWDADTRRRGPALDLRLHDRDDLMRAVVLREVLGPPKGLADLPGNEP